MIWQGGKCTTNTGVMQIIIEGASIFAWMQGNTTWSLCEQIMNS